jgi:ElaB/YqjD/DUF883 family membrane-anchored ribosome-binding protein
MTATAVEQPNSLADQAAKSAENAIRSTERVANEALSSLAGALEETTHKVAQVLARATEQASAMKQLGADSVRDTSQRLTDDAFRVSDSTVRYIKDEPVKAMLIAAAIGATLMALIGVISRPRDRR